MPATFGHLFVTNIVHKGSNARRQLIWEAQDSAWAAFRDGTPIDEVASGYAPG
jgi:hypothetical protein